LFSDTRVTLESNASEARTHCNILPIVQKQYNYNTTLYINDMLQSKIVLQRL